MKRNPMKRIAAISAAVSLMAFSMISAYAADSPTAELTPRPNTLVDSNGNSDTVIFTDTDGETYVTPDDVTLQVHDYSESNKGELPEITQALQNAKDSVDSVTFLDELTPEVNKLLSSHNAATPDTPDINVEDLAVVDIFDVSLVHVDNGRDDYVIDPGKIPDDIGMTFELTFPFEVPDFYVLMHQTPNGEWVVVTDTVKVDGNTIRITSNTIGVFALALQKTGSSDSSIVDDSSESSGNVNDNPPSDVPPGGTVSGDNTSDTNSTSSAAPTTSSGSGAPANSSNAGTSGNGSGGNGSAGKNSILDSNTNPDTGNVALGVSVGTFALLGAALLLTRNKNDKED